MAERFAPCQASLAEAAIPSCSLTRPAADGKARPKVVTVDLGNIGSTQATAGFARLASLWTKFLTHKGGYFTTLRYRCTTSWNHG